MLDLIGRGERIRTSDLTVPNYKRGKNVSIAFSKVAATKEFRSFLHLFRFFTIRYRFCAENSVHKLATTLWLPAIVQKRKELRE